ncbi:acyltransferase family protein [Pseudomonas sp. R76]|uniref:acyltransferase family protein n=1 Tax=Pseudomonas sp. R76 TaxID=1573711 RepID=UPI00132014B7|nr:hypothetical protein [Pseudomonas sp. R76]QHD08367.1 hypothetical protein PspR76_22805 [Pseudomonas sp. R76]
MPILQFLHLWSLGIEEQFYIFFPQIILACSKVLRRFLPVALVSMLVISLFFSQRLLSANPLELFYLLPFGAFELLIGSLIALPAMHIKKSALTSPCLFVLGQAGLIYPIFLYSSQSPFPGLAAAIPYLTDYKRVGVHASIG